MSKILDNKRLTVRKTLVFVRKGKILANLTNPV